MRLFLPILVSALLPAPVHAQATRPTHAIDQEPFITSDLSFMSEEVQLTGRLYAPRGLQRYPVVVLVVGCCQVPWADTVYVAILARGFAKLGIGTFAFDKRGAGKSGGKFTGTNFELLGTDVVSAIRFLRASGAASDIGLWGISQSSWVLPYAIRSEPDIAFDILVSPVGVNPDEQNGYFVRRQAASLGASPREAEDAEALFHALTLYYRGQGDHAALQAMIDQHKNEAWFQAALKNPIHQLWAELGPDAKLATRDQLAKAMRERPDDFDYYRASSTFQDFHAHYDVLTMPTLIIYGSEDDTVPIAKSREVFEAAFARNGNKRYAFMLFGGADHNQQVGGSVRGDYVEAMAGWADSRFKVRAK
jgi:pimeloyl-ACP methyl ester carboxylesterase